MHALDDLIATKSYRAPAYKTDAELRSILGRPMEPCQTCGAAILAVLHTGEVRCEDCAARSNGDQPTQPIQPSAIAFRVIILVAPDGAHLAEDAVAAAAFTEACRTEVDLLAAGKPGRLGAIASLPPTTPGLLRPIELPGSAGCMAGPWRLVAAPGGRIAWQRPGLDARTKKSLASEGVLIDETNC